jgi:succinoglycan biosynthesis protein ExoM
MLLQCLSSLKPLKEPEGVHLSIVIVDNEAAPACAALVQSFARENVPFHYVHEPRRGISMARNAILDKAAQIGADWIAMLDDDQVVKSDWLHCMCEAVRLEEADVVQGTAQPGLPDPLPIWAFPKPKRKDWKRNATHAATNGVLFKASLVDRMGAPLRFDERFGLVGGGDRDFFRRAFHAGARIVWTPEAVSTESVPASKLTFRAQITRTYYGAIVAARQDHSYYGLIPTLKGSAVKTMGALVGGLLAILLAPVAALHEERGGRKQLLKGSKRLATAAGIVVGLLGSVQPQLYRTIHGN